MNGATSVWRLVSNDILQGSVPGPVLLNTFINDLDAGVEWPTSKFTDDAKLGDAVDSLERQKAWQMDLDMLEHQAVIIGMKFNKFCIYIGVIPNTSVIWETSDGK